MAINAKKADYGDQSIKSLKGADRVRKRLAGEADLDDDAGGTIQTKPSPAGSEAAER